MSFPNVVDLQYSSIKDNLPEFLLERLRVFLTESNEYHPQPEELIQKISQRYRIREENIFITAGADEAILAFARTYGRRTYIFTPTFISYGEVRRMGGSLIDIPSLNNNDYVINTNTLNHASLIYLANPNNPVGSISIDQVLTLVQNNRQAVVFVDEVYADFANYSVINYVDNYPNLVVCRSFSKSYGMAGNRVGFFVAHPYIISAVKKEIQWANTSYLSVGAALIAMDNEEYFYNKRVDLAKRKNDFQNFLKGLGFICLSTDTNFTLIKFENERQGEHFTLYLKQNGILVNNGNGNSNIGLDKSYVRIVIGTQDQMGRLSGVIESYK